MNNNIVSNFFFRASVLTYQSSLPVIVDSTLPTPSNSSTLLTFPSSSSLPSCPTCTSYLRCSRSSLPETSLSTYWESGLTEVADVLTPLEVSATTFHPLRHLDMCLRTPSMPSCTLSSCWDPAHSSPRPGSMCPDHPPKM